MAGARLKSKIKAFTSWSFSRYSDYVLCPFKAFLSHIQKHPAAQIKNDAMMRGADIHKEAEAFLKGGMSTLPKSLIMFTDLFKRLKTLAKKSPAKLVIEDSWAFTKEWAKTTWNDWEGCWVRIKLDALEFVSDTEAIVYDWKTGKYSDYQIVQYEEQLELYALGSFLTYPKLEKVHPKLIFLDQGYTHDKAALTKLPLVYTRKADFENLKKRWAKRVLPMFKDRTFPPKPNKLCSWCPFRAEQGGPCKY